MFKFIIYILVFIPWLSGCMIASYPMSVVEEQIPSSNNITILGVGQPLKIMVKLTDEYSNLDKGMAIVSKYTNFTDYFDVKCRIGELSGQIYNDSRSINKTNINNYPTFDFDLIPKKSFTTNHMEFNQYLLCEHQLNIPTIHNN